MNANDATLTELATAQSGSMVKDDAPNAPAGGGFDLIIAAVAGSALGSSGAPYTLTVSAIDLTAASQPGLPRSSTRPSTAPAAGSSAAPAPTTPAP